VIVVDVNVLAYLFIAGPETAAVEALHRTDPDWAAPLLWRSEWRSVLAGYLRRGDLDRRTALDLTELARRMVAGREYPVEDQAVLDVVLDSGLSAYNADYVAAAWALGAPLATFDRQVLRAFPEIARRP